MTAVPVSGIVVAGGQSRRLGCDKRALRLWGEDGPTLLAHTVQILAPLCAEVIVVLNDPGAWPDLPAGMVPDAIPDSGAMGGIYSGLEAAQHDYGLVVSADMPFLNAALLAFLLAQPRGYDALVPQSADAGKTRNRLNAEPLHAVYRRDSRAYMREALEAGQRSIMAYFERARTVYLPPEALSAYDLARALLNVNTPEELAHVRALIAGERGASG